MRDKWIYKRWDRANDKWSTVAIQDLRLGDVFMISQRQGGPSPVGYAAAHVATSDPYQVKGTWNIDTANAILPG